MVTSTAPSYTVSVTQTHTSGSSVNVSTLPGPSYYNYASPCSTGYTSWPTPTSPYDWSYPYMPIPPPPPSSQLPPAPPMAEENPQFKLCFIVGNISKCTGCGNRYPKPAIPPYDICVQHREWRSFFSPGGAQQSRFAPAYYHVNVSCIQKNWPMFQPHQLTVAVDVLSKLTPQHKDILAMFGYPVM